MDTIAHARGFIRVGRTERVEAVTIRGILAFPAAYRAFDVLIGVTRLREIFVREHVRPVPGQRLLDIGCGPGGLVPWLPGVDYWGVDPSPEYIRAAQLRNPGYRFSCARFDACTLGDKRFDLAVAAGVLHHLDDDEALELVRLAGTMLRPGGRLVTLDGCHVPRQRAAVRWLLSHDRGRHVRSREAYERLVRSAFPVVKATVREDLLRIPYVHLVLECTRA